MPSEIKIMRWKISLIYSNRLSIIENKDRMVIRARGNFIFGGGEGV
jgi:hypothetical protein